MPTSRFSSDPRLPSILAKVRTMGAAVARQCPPHVSTDDMVSAGNLGVATAISRYTPESGDLEAYALVHARGAMLDELRRGDPLTREARRTARKLTRTLRTLRTTLHREPEEQELAEALGLETGALRALQLQMSFRAISIDAPLNAKTSDSIELMDEATSAEDVMCIRQEAQRVEATLWEEVAKLRPRHAETIERMFKEEETQMAISEKLGVTKARISQIRRAALTRLRAACTANDVLSSSAVA